MLCVEEPENYLYHELWQDFAAELDDYAKRGGQVFVSTHSPEFLDALELENIYIVCRDQNSYSRISQASKQQQLREYAKRGNYLGSLWAAGEFEI